MSVFEQILKKIPDIQNEMFDLMTELYPICRSITGNGVRKTLEIIGKHIKVEIKEIASGSQVFDWTIPKEWNVSDAYVIDPKGAKIIDFKKSNLHVLNYSMPIRKKMSLEKLKPHLHTLPDQPDLIPYLTSYYKEDWGFCMSHNQFQKLEEGEYEVCIDSSITDGYLTYGEYFLKGQVEDEVLISCYLCHPSLCNDNLSGVVLTTFLAKYLGEAPLRYSYRFLFIPETIGAIAWLSVNEENVSKIKYGLVATCVGDSGISTYKKSRQGNAEIDKIAIHVLKHSGTNYNVVDFFPTGSDERQFCSPAFNLAVGSLVRTLYDCFPEYHTSADNLEFVKKEYLGDSYSKYLSIISILEQNKTYLNRNPKCEPQLGRRGLYRMIGAQKDGHKRINELALFWILNLSDGSHSLLEIAERSNLEFNIVKNAADALYDNDLLREILPNA
jgi:aminopeptidase-like protein